MAQAVMPGGRDLSVSSCATVLSTSSSHLPLLFKKLTVFITFAGSTRQTIIKVLFEWLMLVQLPERPLNHCDLTVFGSREECGWLGNGAAPSSLSVPSVSSAAVPQWLSLGVCALHLLVILLLFKLSKHFFQSSWKFSWPFKDDSKSSVFAFWSALVKWLWLHVKLGLGLSSGWELLTSWLVCVS